MEIPSFVLAIIAISTSVIANIFSKRASSHLAVWTDFISFDILMCLLFYGLGTTTYLLLLRKVPMSTAYPLFSSTFVLVMLVSRFYFGEPIGGLKLAGIILVLTGIALIAMSANRVS